MRNPEPTRGTATPKTSTVAIGRYNDGGKAKAPRKAAIMGVRRMLSARPHCGRSIRQRDEIHDVRADDRTKIRCRLGIARRACKDIRLASALGACPFNGTNAAPPSKQQRRPRACSTPRLVHLISRHPISKASRRDLAAGVDHQPGSGRQVRVAPYAVKLSIWHEGVWQCWTSISTR